jgi:hypothetical protein
VNQGRISPKDWATEIVGIEGFSAYRNPMWDCYTRVVNEDFSLETYWSYAYFDFDVVLMIDSLEHLAKEVGAKLLKHLIENNKHMIVSCPDGDFAQGAVYGNEHERHRGVWRMHDFAALGAHILHHAVCTVAYFKGQK